MLKGNFFPGVCVIPWISLLHLALHYQDYVNWFQKMPGVFYWFNLFRSYSGNASSNSSGFSIMHEVFWGNVCNERIIFYTSKFEGGSFFFLNNDSKQCSISKDLWRIWLCDSLEIWIMIKWNREEGNSLLIIQFGCLLYFTLSYKSLSVICYSCIYSFQRAKVSNVLHLLRETKLFEIFLCW